MAYTLKSNAINTAASLFFVGDNGLSNLVSGGGSVTTVGTIGTATFEGHTVYGDGASGVPSAQYLQSTVAAIATNQKFAVLLVGHTGYSANDTDDYWGGPTFGGGASPATPPNIRMYVPSWGNASAPGITGYSFPNTKLHAFIYGRETGNNIKNYAEGTGAVALAANAYSGFSVASGTWRFGGTVTAAANAGFGVAIFAVFIGVSPTELADYIAANGTGSTEAEKVYSALLDAGASDGSASGSVASASLTAPTGSATGTSPNGSASGSFGAVTLTAPNGTATGSTLNGSASGAVSAVSLTAATGSASGTTSGAGTITLGPLKNNTGTVLALLTGITVHVYQTSGALVVTKTGQTTNDSGMLVASDAAIAAATEYRCVIVLGTGAEGMDKATAA